MACGIGNAWATAPRSFFYRTEIIIGDGGTAEVIAVGSISRSGSREKTTALCTGTADAVPVFFKLINNFQIIVKNPSPRPCILKDAFYRNGKYFAHIFIKILDMAEGGGTVVTSLRPDSRRRQIAENRSSADNLQLRRVLRAIAV
ncbi:hypothetical protein RY831_16545 [Noviherbaspirillum sp. CPCC 100848]|uniref:Uncharacterized protein n=1 Tax=Noviherbaspirillum album TaxID=3080276 RepID=A0ABU6JBS8_9BURK|nr:hypothetical protein [Noviherbaspirillum sp. CPCC 100848]MEC4720775.1 hypothetical protein [Noviherbaspirillum sp. CPCC 100848]